MAKAPNRTGKADMSLVSPDKRKEIGEKVKLKVAAERQVLAEEALEAELLADERREVGLDEAMVPVTIDLAEYADRLILDGVTYFHGRTYTVPQSKYDVIAEQCQRSFNHQAELDGKRADPRKQKNLRMGPNGVTGSMRV